MHKWLAIPLFLLAACGDFSPEKTIEHGRTQMDNARAIRMRHEIRYFENELMQSYVLHGEWPPDWTFLRRSALDPWGCEYEYVIEGEQATVFSAGPDGEMGTADDVYGR
jgi:hypothetical protein